MYVIKIFLPPSSDPIIYGYVCMNTVLTLVNEFIFLYDHKGGAKRERKETGEKIKYFICIQPSAFCQNIA